MKVYEIHVSFCKTVQVPQYEPVKITTGGSATVEEHEDRKEAFKALHDEVKRRNYEFLQEYLKEQE